jgi:actin related protein 2/3 complex subunit 2
MEVAPDAGYDVAIQFDCDAVANSEAFLNAISSLRRNIAAGPLDAAFRALVKKESQSSGLVSVNYRKNEFMYICPSSVKVVVIFLVDFADITDKALARVFLQEFLEAQRLIRTGPPVSYSREPPGELASLNLGTKYNDTAGFISFSIEERLLTGPKMESLIDNLVGFRNYLHYHIKCSKTYLHMRMRKRVAGWLQVLNRAVPEVDSEKKTASGKTFVRK